jgi:hypothetical protein
VLDSELIGQNTGMYIFSYNLTSDNKKWHGNEITVLQQHKLNY